VLAFVSGIGLGFAINDFVLFPLLALALLFTFYSMWWNKKHHVKIAPIVLAALSTIVILVGIFFPMVIWAGIVGLIVATVWDYILIRTCKTC